MAKSETKRHWNWFKRLTPSSALAPFRGEVAAFN